MPGFAVCLGFLRRFVAAKSAAAGTDTITGADNTAAGHGNITAAITVSDARRQRFTVR